MPSLRLEDLSSFGRLAVKLDGHFSELVRLSGQIDRLDIESEGGLTHAVKLLNEFAEHGNAISEHIQDFSKALQEVQQRSEAAAKHVAERAQLIHGRKQKQNEIRERLDQVEQEVQAAGVRLAGFKKDGKTELTNEEKHQVRTELERLNEILKKFEDEVQGIKETAREAKFKSLEHDAKNVLDALRASSRRIEKAVRPD
jgi:chromosome segregation ATPase